MTRPHRAQLLVCHEQIVAGVRGAVEDDAQLDRTPKQFCHLGAYAWCFTCGYFVCDIHLNSRHNGEHDTQIEYPNRTFTPGGQRPT